MIARDERPARVSRRVAGKRPYVMTFRANRSGLAMRVRCLQFQLCLSPCARRSPPNRHSFASLKWQLISRLGAGR